MVLLNSSAESSLSQSTIYKRHQARVLKNMSKADDPRPKVVRVLAGLPGFRIILPDYQASVTAVAQTKTLSPPSTPSSLQQQEVSLSNFAADETVLQLQPTRSDHNNSTTNATTELSLAQPLHVTWIAGTLGAVAEACYGSSTAGKTKSVSPFSSTSIGAATCLERAAVPVVHEQSNLSLFRLASSSSSSTPGGSLLPHHYSTAGASLPATTSQLLAGASTASVLFGTKALAEQYLLASQPHEHHDDDQQQQSSTATMISLSSSALAGVMVAATSRFHPGIERRFLSHLPSQPSPTVVARHAVGATLYFSSYDMLKSCLLATNNNESHSNNNNTGGMGSMLAIAISGATAGALYQSVLLWNRHSLVAAPTTIGMLPTAAMGAPITTTTTITTARMVPAMLRAAPAHALLFVGYEWVRSSTGKQS